MSLILFQQYPLLLIAFVFIIGLVVGSFINVVIYRLPVMMKNEWRQECHIYLELPYEAEDKVFNLSLPASHCPHCKTEIKVYQNIPILSYLFLGGKCGHCREPISCRYPLIEAFTGLCSALVAWHFGYSLALIFALLLTWSLIALSFIDIDHQLLPDSITQPLLWLGLFLSLFQLFTDTHASIIGAVAGYLILWVVYQVFKLLTGKEGMGYGDFKLLALFGAWLGWQYLAQIIFIASLLGAVVGISLIAFSQREAAKPMPFGQYIAVAGWIALLWGREINDWYFQVMGMNVLF
jgi:leader peptidase (prepilin peptidase)/N-methyltransferase